MVPAPIVLFVFRRPEHTRRTIESLLANPEAARSEVIVFADGARSERELEAVERTREVVRRAGIPNLRLVERERNVGLARSVIAGVTEVCDARGKVIVLEDDLVLSQRFLRFMNDALDRYRDERRVFGISGYTWPIVPPPGAQAFFLPFIGSWGWATWARAWATLAPAAESRSAIGASRTSRRRFDLDGSYPYWAMLEDALAGRTDSWAVRWYATVFRRDGLMLYPARSLVTNVGLDGTGVHCGEDASRSSGGTATDLIVREFPAEAAVDDEAFRRVKRLLRRDHGPLPRLARRARAAMSGLLRIPSRAG